MDLGQAVAKVIINSRTGTIVIGQNVKVSPAAVTHGSLTVTIWGADTDNAEARLLVRQATQIAGRVLFAGVPTGVAVGRDGVIYFSADRNNAVYRVNPQR